MALEAEAAETESGEDEAKEEDEDSINWNEVCQITKFVKVFFHPILSSSLSDRILFDRKRLPGSVSCSSAIAAIP